MARRKKPICGLDISPQSITLAQCIPEDKMVTNVSIQPLDAATGDFWEAVDEGLKSLMGGMRAGAFDAVASLPSEYSVIKMISLDSDETEIESSLDWEFGQQIIGSADEYASDYQRCTFQDDPGAIRYLVVGYRATAVDRLARILRTHKLNPLVIDLDIFALANVYEVNYPDLASEPTLIIQADENKSKLALAKGGDFFDMEVVEHSSADQTAGSYAAVIAQAREKLLSCNEGFAAAAEAVRTYVSGALFSGTGFPAEAIQAIGNAEMLFPFRKVSCTAGMSEEDLHTYSPQLAVAVGLALRGSEEIV